MNYHRSDDNEIRTSVHPIDVKCQRAFNTGTHVCKLAKLGVEFVISVTFAAQKSTFHSVFGVPTNSAPETFEFPGSHDTVERYGG